MNCVTEFRRPVPRYGRADAGWRSKTGWELVDGAWQRWWFKGQLRRRARVWRAAGSWTWSVSERGPRGIWTEAARDGHGGIPHFVAQAAWPYAELAAVTK